MISRTNGTILIGGDRLSGPSSLDGFDLSRGSFFAPTIITDIDTEDELWQEEIFGPVIVVKKFSVRCPIAPSNIHCTNCLQRPKKRGYDSRMIANTA